MEQVRGGRVKRLREIRESAGFTQEALAFHAGVALRTVQRAESDADPSLAVLRKLATALDVPVAELLDEEPAA